MGAQNMIHEPHTSPLYGGVKCLHKPCMALDKHRKNTHRKNTILKFKHEQHYLRRLRLDAHHGQ
jgi:hypothetical protein